MARVKTNTVNVKINDNVKIPVTVECANVDTVSVDSLKLMYESQWKQYMYSTVQQTIKELYPSVSVNKATLESMKTIFGATDEQIAKFIEFQEKSMGTKFETQLPNHFTLESDLVITYSHIEVSDTESEPDLTEDEPETEN